MEKLSTNGATITVVPPPQPCNMKQNISTEEEQQFFYPANVLKDFRLIHTFIFDVDGVLTNGEILITEKGDLLRKMNIRDGFALRRAMEEGFRVVILTGGNSKGVVDRLEALGIKDVISNAGNKLKYYEGLLDLYQLDEQGILYMGDDLPDYQVMRRVGFPCCPNDATAEIMEISKYISPFKGGEGCVRDVVEKVMKLKGAWKV